MKLPVISLSGEELSSFNDAIEKEWLVTNGLGGYASSTVLGVNTRKYHGLLVAALHPPGDRTVCLAKLDEDIVVGDGVFRLGMNEFQTGFFPNGHAFLKEFSVAPFPKYVYVAGDVTVEKTIFIPKEKNAVATIYKLTNGSSDECKARVFPLLTCRHFHAVVDRLLNPLNLREELRGRSVEVTFDKPKATIIMSASEGVFVQKSNWVNRLFYREERNRGESSFDDCFQPGYFEFSVSPQTVSEFALVAAADENQQEGRTILESVGANTLDIKRSLDVELKEKTDFLANFYHSQKRTSANEWLNLLLLASDSFIVRARVGSRSVIAGYHWFEAWGRDTFVSLPGLLLVTGRYTDAERVLLHFARYVKKGLVPNFIPDKSGEPAYNTVDAALWYVNAVLQYLKYTGDFRFVEENLWEALKTIIENYQRGTAFGIHVDNDGLLAHGPQLTWMDGEANGEAVTPRTGKAVEIQALWYNALRTAQLLAAKFGHKSLSWRCSDMACKAQDNFNRKFWNREKACLFDVVKSSGVDASLRPNQIIATALDFPILHLDKAEPVVDLVYREFFTPFGLRTLARTDPGYRGVYEGNHANRDRAYHNGTVWPWLLGPFTTAFLKAKGSEPDRRDFALSNFLMTLFSKQLFEAGLGTVSEVFDGDPPHTPKGCISQAWSVAEPLRAYVEDVMQVRPVHEKSVL